VDNTQPTAAKRNRAPRVPPKWIEGRASVTVLASLATKEYYDLHQDTKFVSWHDTYGSYRQGAKVAQA
jgi:hypothetical protein